MFLDYSAASPERRFSVPAPASHRSVVLLAPIGEVVAESYPIRTVIQFSFFPSIGSSEKGRKLTLSIINWELFCHLHERIFVNFL